MTQRVRSRRQPRWRPKPLLRRRRSSSARGARRILAPIMRSTTASLLPFSRRGGSNRLRPSGSWLSAVADVRPGEAGMALTLALTVFLLLTAYYLLKVAREPLILLGGGAEVKAYAAAGQAVLLIFVVKGFTTLSQRVGRLRLVTLVTLFFVANLVIFFGLGRLGFPLGIPF